MKVCESVQSILAAALEGTCLLHSIIWRLIAPLDVIIPLGPRFSFSSRLSLIMQYLVHVWTLHGSRYVTLDFVVG